MLSCFFSTINFSFYLKPSISSGTFRCCHFQTTFCTMCTFTSVLGSFHILVFFVCAELILFLNDETKLCIFPLVPSVYLLVFQFFVISSEHKLSLVLLSARQSSTSNYNQAAIMKLFYMTKGWAISLQYAFFSLKYTINFQQTPLSSFAGISSKDFLLIRLSMQIFYFVINSISYGSFYYFSYQRTLIIASFISSIRCWISMGVMYYIDYSLLIIIPQFKTIKAKTNHQININMFLIKGIQSILSINQPFFYYHLQFFQKAATIMRGALQKIFTSIDKLINYNLFKPKITYIKLNLMDSLEQTLRKSRQVQQRYKKYLQQKAESDKSWAQTQAKIERTMNRLSQTKDTIKQIDQLYQNYQKSFQNAINSALEKLQSTKLIQVADPDFVPHHATPKQASQIIKKKKKVVFMTGAGVSAASGIPTFRDKDGYWTKKKLENISPEDFLTFSKFSQTPNEIWQWLQDFYCTKNKCKPNIGHGSIDSICNKILKKKGQVCIVTQNIDNFHNQSKSKDKSALEYPIYQVHGNILQVRCDLCAKDKDKMVCYPYSQYRQQIKQGKPAKCPKCTKQLRPHIMFFDQFYQEKYHHSDSVKNFVENSDLLIVIGTALQTGLARMTVQSFLIRKVDIIQINTQCTIRQKNVFWMEGKGDQILNKINNSL